MSKKVHVQTTINGEGVDFLCEPRNSLLEVLRDDLDLTGAKEGCNNGNCGACNVIMDGRLVNSCCVLGVEADGCEITTIEGIGSAANLHPLQQKSSNTPRCNAESARPGSSSPPRHCWTRTRTPRKTRCATGWPATCAAARGTTRSSVRSWTPGTAPEPI